MTKDRTKLETTVEVLRDKLNQALTTQQALESERENAFRNIYQVNLSIYSICTVRVL